MQPGLWWCKSQRSLWGFECWPMYSIKWVFIGVIFSEFWKAGWGKWRDCWGELPPQGRGQKKEADGGSGGLWDKRLLPVDRGNVLHNTVIETEGGIKLGVGGRACLLNDALLMHSHWWMDWQIALADGRGKEGRRGVWWGGVTRRWWVKWGME